VLHLRRANAFGSVGVGVLRNPRRHRLANCDTTPDVSANGLTDEPRFPRRAFLAATGAAAAGLGLTGAAKATRSAVPRDLRTWPGVRRDFVLRTPPIHFDTFLLASHPSAVRAAIDRYRRALDADPHEYLNERQGEIERPAPSAVFPGQVAIAPR
jgi:hypothetical protein